MLRVNAEAGRRTKEEMAARLLRAIVFFQQHQQQRVGISNPRPHRTPSQPGEYPRKRTGFGQKGVVYAPGSVPEVIAEGLRVRAGQLANSHYMLILETKRDRLGFAKTFGDLAPQLKRILGQKA